MFRAEYPPIPDPGVMLFATTAGIVAAFLLLGFIWPFWATLYRYRAHYRPKGLIALGGSELDLSVPVDPMVKGYWSLFSRVKRLEGLRGLWKGLGAFAVYTIISTLVMIFFPILPFVTFKATGNKPITAVLAGIFIIGAYILTFIGRTFLIRAIVWTREARGSSCPFHIFRRYAPLFNSLEKKNFFKVCSIPGLVVSYITTDFASIGFMALRLVLVGLPDKNPKNPPQPLIPLNILVSILFDVFLALVTCPLEVLSIRLASHTYQPQGLEVPILAGANEEATSPQTYAATPGVGLETAAAPMHEEVISVRSDPYLGFIDCAKTIVKEEGWSTFWRGWFIPAFFIVLTDTSLYRGIKRQ